MDPPWGKKKKKNTDSSHSQPAEQSALRRAARSELYIEVARVEPASAITHEQVESLHHTFVEELRALFDKHKGACGYKDAVLEIF